MGLPKFGGLLLGVFLIRMIIYLGPELRPTISASPHYFFGKMQVQAKPNNKDSGSNKCY